MFHWKEGFTGTSEDHTATWGKFSHPTKVDTSKVDDQNKVGGIINVDDRRVELAIEVVDAARSKYNAFKTKYKVGDDAKKENFSGDKKIFQSYKDARKALKKAKEKQKSAEEAYEKTERAICDLKYYHETEYNVLKSLKDNVGNAIIVYISSYVNIDQPAQTLIRYDDYSKSIYTNNPYNKDKNKPSYRFNSVYIQIDTSTSLAQVAEKLSHEKGHIVYMLQDPKNRIKKSNQAINCREDHDDPFVKPAINAENAYLKAKRKKNN